jgi:hypothetical protein
MTRAKALILRGVRVNGRNIYGSTALQKVIKKASRRQSCKRNELIKEKKQFHARLPKDISLSLKVSAVGGSA